ncbi:hypothetical protein LBMAG42_04030 [Deltaproteobacteria bacterium]|nr:hypothetical protein LBMAG42_04030 [Deltaproteobacteria bacterium]
MAARRQAENESGTTRAQALAASRMREAFAALMKDARAERIYQGSANQDTQTARGRFQAAYLNCVRDALQEMPVLMMEVSPEGIHLGDTVVVESTERRGDLVEMLFSEGLRGISVEAGVSEDELITMGRLLLTPWHNMGPNDEDLSGAVWRADFAHVYLEIVDALADRDHEEAGESPIVRELAGLVAELNARAEGADETEVSRLRQDELAVLLRVRDQVDFTDAGAEAARLRLESNLSPQLMEEVRAAREDQDMVKADVAGLLTACLEAAGEAEQARNIGEALFNYVINAVLAEGGGSSLVQRTAELLDADLTPHLAHREAVRDAAAVLAQEPTRSRLARLFTAADAKDASGLAFTLFFLLPGEDEAIAIAPLLPAWAVRVLADTVLLRAAPEPLVAIDVAKRFMSHPERGGVLIGLAMAARQKDPRLIEGVLVHAKDAADEVREAVLVALRNHQTPKIREAVRAALNDAAERVRLEALRFCVAYRDLEVVSELESRLQGAGLSQTSVAEVRAMCIAVARINGVNSLQLLVELADGARPARHPELPRLALHGLRAMNTEAGRAAMGRVALVVPALADEVHNLLREVR